MDLDNSLVFYISGAVFAVLALMYFGVSFVFNLSPVVKSFLLLSVSASFLLTAQRYKSFGVNTLAYVLSAGAFTVFLGYTLAKFQPGPEKVLLSLAASSILFLGLGYTTKQDMLELGRREAMIGFLVLSGGVLLIVAVDVVGEQPSYQLDLNQTANTSSGGSIGELRIENRFFLPRELDIPEYQACNREAHIDVNNPRPGILGGSNSMVLEVVAHFRPDNNFSESLEVEKVDSCSTASKNTLSIIQRDYH